MLLTFSTTASTRDFGFVGSTVATTSSTISGTTTSLTTTIGSSIIGCCSSSIGLCLDISVIILENRSRINSSSFVFFFSSAISLLMSFVRSANAAPIVLDCFFISSFNLDCSCWSRASSVAISASKAGSEGCPRAAFILTSSFFSLRLIMVYIVAKVKRTK